MVVVEHSVTFRGDLQSAWDKLVDWSTMHDWDIFIDQCAVRWSVKSRSRRQSEIP